MKTQTNRIQLILASKQFLLRLGIKTLLSIIDIETDIIEIESLDDLKDTYMQMNSSCYTIISSDLNADDNEQFYDNLKKIYPASRFLVIESTCCNAKQSNSDFILQTDQQSVILQKIQDFFSPPKEAEQDKAQVILSDREVDVLKAVALGLSNKQIAEKLFISTNTVVTHRKNITEKLGIKTIAGLTVYALMNQLIQPEEVQG